MVHTLPPWTTKYKMTKIFGQIDTGELAARLGSPSVEDRRGNVVWYDDFEGASKKWAYTVTGAGSAVALNAAYSWRGSQAMKITTADDPDDVCGIDKYFNLPSETRIGVEIHALFRHTKEKLYIVMTGYDGGHYYDAELIFDRENLTLEYLDSDNVPQTLDNSVSYYSGYEQWLLMKLVIDWDTKKYVRAIVGDTEYDLSTYNIRTVASLENPILWTVIWGYPTDANNHDIYIDDFILTQNEP